MYSYKLTKGEQIKVEMATLPPTEGQPESFSIEIRHGKDRINFYCDSEAELSSFAAEVDHAFKGWYNEKHPPIGGLDQPAAGDTDWHYPQTGQHAPANASEPAAATPEFPHGPSDRGCPHVQPGEPACGTCWARDLTARSDASNQAYYERIRLGDLTPPS